MVAVAGGSGGGRYIFQAGEEGIGGLALKADAGGVGQALPAGAVEPHGRAAIFPQAGFQAVAGCRHLPGIVGQVLVNQRAGRAQADQFQDIFGAGAAVLFVIGPVHKLFQPDAGPNVERANAFGGVELMAGQGQQVNAQGVHFDRDFADGLSGVGVQQGSATAGDCGDFGNRLDAAHFVVGVH